jgi:hypothetical protein
MKVIAKDRGLGKTTKLLKIAQENQYAFVCCNQHEARRIKHMGLNIPFLFTFEGLRNHASRGYKIDGFVVDNADLCIPNTIWTNNWGEAQTKELIKLSAKHWKYISVSDHIPNLAYSIAAKAEEMGLDIPFPVFHHERCHIKPTLFHDPEEYLRSIANRPIEYVTTSRINTINLIPTKPPSSSNQPPSA